MHTRQFIRCDRIYMVALCISVQYFFFLSNGSTGKKKRPLRTWSQYFSLSILVFIISSSAEQLWFVETCRFFSQNPNKIQEKTFYFFSFNTTFLLGVFYNGDNLHDIEVYTVWKCTHVFIPVHIFAICFPYLLFPVLNPVSFVPRSILFCSFRTVKKFEREKYWLRAKMD